MVRPRRQMSAGFSGAVHPHYMMGDAIAGFEIIMNDVVIAATIGRVGQGLDIQAFIAAIVVE